MYQGYANDLEFDMSVTVDRDCPITCTVPDNDCPFFTFHCPSGGFQLHFDVEALRELVTITDDALAEMDTSHIQEDPATVDTGPANSTAEHLPWVWINQGCRMNYIIRSGESMFFTLGTASNLFEPKFHVEALSRFVRLAREALTLACVSR